MINYKPGASLSRSRNAQVNCATPGVSSLERVRFFPRQLLTPDDLMQEQEYFRAKSRRHNRMLHGWGIVCGCEVQASDDDWTVCVTPGYLLGPQGDEIVIDDCVKVDLSLQDVDGNAFAGCADAVDPWCSSVKGNLKSGTTVYLAAAYSECYSRPVRVQSAGCGCDDSACEYSRIRDSYVLRVLTSLPTSYDDILKPPDIDDIFDCPRPCPPCVEEPWVILAAITIKGKTISDDDIDGSYRRYVASFGSFFFTCQDEKPQTDLLSVNRVAVLNPNQQVLAEMSPGNVPSGSTPWSLTVPAFEANMIDVEFVGAALDYASVVDGQTFIVRRQNNQVALGNIVNMPNNTVRWILRSEVNAFGPGIVTVMLIGGSSNTQPAIKATSGSLLDGSMTNQLPSGDGTEGGNFVFTIQVVANT